MLRVKSFLGIWSLKTGTICSGIGCIIMTILTIIILFTVNADWKTLFIDVDKNIARIIFTIFLCMTIFYSTLLIIGALKKKTLYMFPWVSLTVVAIPGILISVLYTSIMFFLEKHVLEGIICLLLGLVFNVICAYAWLVTYSYYKHLKAEKLNNKTGPYGKPYAYQRP